MALEKISVAEAKKIASKVGVKPAVVKGTDLLRFMKNESENLKEITWDEFEKILKKNKLAVYASGEWMKIMREK